MKDLKSVVDKYLIDNFDIITKQREKGTIKWNEWAIMIGTYYGTYNVKPPKELTGEYCRQRFRKIREKVVNKSKDISLQEGARLAENIDITQNLKFQYTSGKEDKSKGTKEFSFTADNIPSEEEIISHFNIDTTKYRISQIWHKTSFGGKYSISVNLQLLKGIEASNYTEQFDKFIQEYNKTIFVNQTKTKFPEDNRDIKSDVLYLVSLSDLHIGNYQKEGYLEAIKQRVFQTFKSIADSGVSKVIILNTGDMLHTNGSNETTLSGTQLDSQESFEDAFTQGLDFTTSVIDYAASLSLSVTYVNVRGNHSFDTEYCLGEALKKIYEKQSNIEILNQRDTRIYYYWNNNAFLFSHGDKAVERLPLLFATEGKEVFQKAENHHILLGHTHHNSSKQFINDRKEFSGIEVRVLGSPTSNDQWHKKNGFTGNKKSIISMLFTPEEGKYAEFNFKLFK